MTTPKPTAAELDADRPRLRALVAEKVMGWRAGTRADTYAGIGHEGFDPEWLAEPSNRWLNSKGQEVGVIEDEGVCREDYETGWKPDTSMTDAWLVVEAMRAKHFAVRIETNRFDSDDLVAIWSTEDHPSGAFNVGGEWGNSTEPETAPLAICLAALTAVGAAKP